MTRSGTPVRFVYLLSSGRSGSTLLELLLATHPAVDTLGELILLPGLARDPSARCACGQLLGKCPTWRTVLAGDAGAAARTPDPFRERADAGRTLRPAMLPDLLTGRPRRATERLARDYTRRVLDVVDRAVPRPVVTGPRSPVVVDASKDPYRLAMFAFAGTVDLWVVHLVRDPRGYVTSTRREGDGLTLTARRSARWAIQQQLAGRLRRLVPPPRWTTVRYENLATTPAQVLDRLGAWLALPPEFDPAGFRSYRSHAIGGNPMRSRSDPVRLDERWRRDLPPAHARACWAIAGRTAHRYGYRRDGGT